MAKLERFENRLQAGALLAQRLGSYARRPDVIVLALPRCGVPVGFAVAQELEVPLDILLVRKLGVPGHLFAHGSGSSRLSPRNNYVAGELRKAGMGTLLLDLLTPDEDRNHQTRFNISLLTERLNTAADWLRHNSSTASLPIGLFGASTGAAAALQLAAAVR